MNTTNGTTSSSLTTAAAGGGAAEGQYIAAKTSVWWDIENCQVPHGFDPTRIAQNISSSLVKLNYCGPVSISAYGDTYRIPPAVQQALSSTGISLNHVPAGNFLFYSTLYFILFQYISSCACSLCVSRYITVYRIKVF